MLSLMSLKSLEGLLPADRFVRVHRSYIVQPSKVRVIERKPHRVRQGAHPHFG